MLTSFFFAQQNVLGLTITVEEALVFAACGQVIVSSVLLVKILMLTTRLSAAEGLIGKVLTVVSSWSFEASLLAKTT